MSPKRSKRTKEPSVPEKKKTREPVARRKKRVYSFKIYLHAVLKQVHPSMGISRKAMETMNTFMFDMFDRITAEVSRLQCHTKKRTLSSRDMQTAVKLLLPGELAKHAISEGTKAVKNYTKSIQIDK